MYMGLGLIGLSAVKREFTLRAFHFATKLIITGTILFTLSIYGLVYLGHHDISSGRMILGPITPVGGSIMIIGWTFLLIHLLKK